LNRFNFSNLTANAVIDYFLTAFNNNCIYFGIYLAKFICISSSWFISSV